MQTNKSNVEFKATLTLFFAIASLLVGLWFVLEAWYNSGYSTPVRYAAGVVGMGTLFLASYLLVIAIRRIAAVIAQDRMRVWESSNN